MEYKVKKYTFKGILLAMGLVFATLSVQAQETRPGMIYCCENVDLDSVSARYINVPSNEIVNTQHHQQDKAHISSTRGIRIVNTTAPTTTFLACTSISLILSIS
jgi:hypothetical protein